MLESIPEELKKLNQWVCVAADSKAPINPYTGFGASSSSSDTWGEFETASYLVEQGMVSNVGFVFNSNGIVGIDIDTGYDEDGFISELAVDIIRHCHSYTEKSRSGRGFHILVKGSLPFTGKNNLQGVEIYEKCRYFIMTGDTLLYKDIVENQEAIDYVLSKYFSGTDERKSKDPRARDRIYNPVWENPLHDGKISLSPKFPKITKGNRNVSLLSIAGGWHNIGYSKEQIYNNLLIVNNTACVPPLDTQEIENICKSIAKYRR